LCSSYFYSFLLRFQVAKLQKVLGRKRGNYFRFYCTEMTIRQIAESYNDIIFVRQSQPQSKKHYWLTIKNNNDKNSIVVVDVFPTKDNIEIVRWRYVDKRGMEKLKRQAECEGGQILILSPDNRSAAALSVLTSDLSTDNDTKNNNTDKYEKSDNGASAQNTQATTETEVQTNTQQQQNSAEKQAQLDVLPKTKTGEFDFKKASTEQTITYFKCNTLKKHLYI
jgi:hypothetical protein